MTSRRFPLGLISTGHFTFYRMHLLTVAGEATARSWTSNNMCMVLLSLILSLLARQSILLSSKTVFMFSIHRASTGPSHTIHLWSSVVSWGEAIKNGHNKRQPEADFLHSWAAILNIYLGKSSIHEQNFSRSAFPAILETGAHYNPADIACLFSVKKCNLDLNPYCSGAPTWTQTRTVIAISPSLHSMVSLFISPYSSPMLTACNSQT